MKLRFGFVSNSSSSSFIIAFNGSKDNLREKLISIFDCPLPDKFPIQSLELIGSIVADYIEDDPIKTLEEWDEFYGDLNNPRENHVRFIERLKSGWTVYYGGFPDHNSLQRFFCNSDIDYEDEEILIWQEGGY